MLNCAFKGLVGVLVGTALVWGCSALRAENDYEYASRLMDIEKESGGFKTQDLVERIISKMQASQKKDDQLEGKLIKAMLLRREVTGASVERKKELLDEANKIYKEFLKEGSSHRLAGECRKAEDEIQLEFVRVLVESAKDSPTAGREARKQAVDILGGIRQRQKADAESAWPLMVEAYKDFQAFLEKNPMEADVPPKILQKIGNAVEKVVVADQAYIQTWLMQIDAYDESDPAKKQQAEELAKYARGRVDSEQLSEFGLACAFYLYSKGRAHSYILDEKSASEAWREALGLLPDDASAEEGAIQTIHALQRMIIYDLVQMKMRAGEKDAAKYEDVIALVKQIKMSPSLRWILEEPAGKQMIIDYACALIRQPDSSAVEVAEAIRSLREIVASGPPWSYNASQTMAKVLVEAGPKKRPRLNAVEWFDTARGFFYQGQQAYRRYEEQKQANALDKAETEYAEAIIQYEQAVEYYRRAIALARNAEICDAVTRLKVEPDAWFEMGLSYQKMDQLLESAVAYRALRNAFEKSARERWLPKKYESKAQEAEVKALADALDREDPKNEGLVKRAGKNIIIALNKLPPTPPNKRLKERMLEGEGEGLEEFGGDIDYDKGKLALVDAKGFEEQATQQERSKNAEQSQKNLMQSLQRYQDAVKAFAEVKTSSPLYEVGLYQAGSSCVLAQCLLVEKVARLDKLKPEDVESQAKDLAEKGMKAFKLYEEYVAKTHNPSPDVEARREKLAKLVKLSRATLTYNAGMVDDCIKACDDYLKTYAADLKETPDDIKLLSVVFNKFRSLSKLGGEKNPPECDTYLDEACKVLPLLRVKDAYYKYALGNMAARYFNASVRAEKAQLDVSVVRGYDRKLADFMTKSLKLKPEKERDLNDYGRLLGTLEKIQDYVAAADIAEEMLRLFDPEGKNCRQADEGWPDILKRMQDTIHYPDLRKMETCRKDHMALIDYIYEDYRNEEMDEARRPEFDKYPVDYNKAQLQLKTIRENYPDCATLDPKQGIEVDGKNKSWLDIVGDEIDFRQRIVATRQLLGDAAIEAAHLVEKDDPERASKYRSVADDQLGILLDIIGNVPSMKLKQGELRVANKDYQGALRILYDVKNGESKNNSSELYVKTSIQISKVYQLMGDGKSAAEYPHFLLTTAGRNSRVVQKYWPDIDDFLKWCYENGAKPLEEVKVDTSLDYRPKTPDETEFAEVVEPAYRVAAEGGADRIPPSTRWRYEFLKAKIDHWNEFVKLDRVLSTYRDRPNKEAVITQDFMTRYETLESLSSKETQLWRLSKDVDEQIVKLGSIDKVNEQRKDMMQKRSDLTTEIDTLSKKLAGLPALELPKDEAKAGAATKPAVDTEKDGSEKEVKQGEAQPEGAGDAKSGAEGEAKKEGAAGSTVDTQAPPAENK